MPDNQPATFDEYERQVGAAVQAWSSQQRLAFVTALAERWLQAYEKFSAAEDWGDPAVLRRIVGAVWDHLGGRPITPADYARFIEQIKENGPDTEEFDQLPAWRALQACLILGYALECCEEPENAAIATKAALAGFEAAVGDWPSDPAGQRRAWRKVAAREEFAKQSALLQAVGSIARFDEQTIATLRGGLETPAEEPVRGRRTKSPSKRKSAGAKDELDGIDGLRAAVSGYLRRSAAHRIAFVAALAERLFPFYAAFAAATGRGRPELLRGALEAVWQAAEGRPIPPATLQDHRAKLQEGAPGAGGLGWGAWSAWRVLGLALECCGSAGSTEPAEEAAVVAYERVAGPDGRKDPRIWKEMWQLPEISQEVMKQTGLLMRLGSVPALDGQTVEALRRSAAT
jgi:uncharacterized protein YjaG (DUF416 family)